MAMGRQATHAAKGEQGTGRMCPQRPPALQGCASRAPPNLHILHDMATGLQQGPSASGQDPDPHPPHEASLWLDWHRRCSEKG